MTQLKERLERGPARDLRHDRLVALKMLRPEPAR